MKYHRVWLQGTLTVKSTLHFQIQIGNKISQQDLKILQLMIPIPMTPIPAKL